MEFSFLPIIVVILAVVIIAIVLVIIGLRRPDDDRENVIIDRLEEFTQSGEEFDLEKIELSQPFSERVIYPIARNFGDFAIRFTPQNALQNVEKKLEMAGSPKGLDPSIFLMLQFVAAIVMGGIIFLVLTIGPTRWPTGRVLIMSLGFAALGFYFPNLWLGSQVNKRQKDVRRALPDALDLLTICVEAGLGFDAAMVRVAEKWESELAHAFSRVIQEIQLGKLRREALRDMADRIGLSELSSFVAAVIQSEQLGVSLAKVLNIQADQMRVKRRQHAEEEAHKAPLKMLIPMALLIFPALMIVLMTPAVIRLVQSSLGGML
ncbi:MAG: type II secretion system F family protein [Anaerolineaceae bacterium]|nr:type II secretion system F family protein [Anaerolineaceae bacterium]